MDQERDGEMKQKERERREKNGVCSVPVFLSFFPFSLLLIGWKVRFIYLFIYLLWKIINKFKKVIKVI